MFDNIDRTPLIKEEMLEASDLLAELSYVLTNLANDLREQAEPTVYERW